MQEEQVQKRLRSILESLLFAVSEPVSLGRLCEVLTSYERKEIQQVLEAMADEYQNDERGFRLQQVANGFQLRTARANADFVKALLQHRPVRLTRASLETLSVVAYRQPVTRAEIEAIRGVDVDAVLNTLLERHLIKVAGRKEVVGRPLLYATTTEFLETFGLKDLSQLPTLEELGESAELLERAATRLAEAEAAAAGDAASAGEDTPLEEASAAGDGEETSAVASSGEAAPETPPAGGVDESPAAEEAVKPGD